MYAIPDTIWEQLAFYSADRIIDRTRESGLAIPDEILELYRIRKSYQGVPIFVEDADVLLDNYDRGVYIRDEFYAAWMGEALEQTYPQDIAGVTVVARSPDSYLEFLTIAGIVSALPLQFDATNAYTWRQDVEHAGATALMREKSEDPLVLNAAYHDAYTAEQHYLAWWLADMLAIYGKRPTRFWYEETEEILYNPQEPPMAYREENFYCVDPGMETENVLIDQEAGYVYKQRDPASDFPPSYWKMKAILSKIVPYVVDMEYEPRCDAMKQRYVGGVRAYYIEDIINLKEVLAEQGYGFISDLTAENVIIDNDSNFHIIDFTIDFGHPDWWRMKRQHRRLKKLQEKADEELEALYQRKEEMLGYRENPNGWDGDGNGYRGRGRFPRPGLERWIEPYSKLEVIVEIGGTDNDFELMAAAEELGRRIGTRVEILPPETAEEDPYKSMLPLAILPNVDTTDKLAQLYFNIEVARDAEPTTFYLFNGRVYAQFFEALMFLPFEEQPQIYSYENWPYIPVGARERQRRGIYARREGVPYRPFIKF